MSASLFHHISKSRAKLVNGYSPVASTDYREQVFDPLRHANLGQFGRIEWDAAQALNITHVTFHPESFPAPNHVSVFPADLTLLRLKQTPTLEWVQYNDPIDLFRVRPQPNAFTITLPETSPIGVTIEGRHSSIPGQIENDATSIMGRVLTQTTPTTNSVFRCRGRIYPSGVYRVSLRLKVTPTTDTASDTVTWTLRAFTSDADATTLAKQTFSANDLPKTDSYGWVSFNMELPQAGRVGFEMTSDAAAVFSLDAWHMVFNDEVGQYDYEAEDLFHAGRVVATTGSQGRGVVQVSNSDPTIGVVRGPYRILAAGDYIATVRIRGIASPTTQCAATLTLSGRTSPTRPLLKTLAKTEWTPSLGADSFDRVTIPFTVPETGTIIECQVDRSPGATLEIDTIQISKSSPHT